MKTTDGLIVDNFAGGGGATLGIRRALGRPVDVAVNHDGAAIVMHAANHPETTHYREDVWNVDPQAATQGLPVALAWFSPDCTYFSKARGGKPRSKSIRGLAWVVLRWAARVRPAVIILENVEEFRGWGRLGRRGHPIKRHKGATFGRWVAQLQALGYAVEWRELVACDYGTPTSRKRLFIVARCDGESIRWPEPTHGPGRAQPWRTAAECIDFTIPTPSIFLTALEARTLRLDVNRPLAEATMRRIAHGVKRFVLDDPNPFLIALTHHGAERVYPLGQPAPTITAANRGELALIAPTLIQTGQGERAGQAPRVPGLQKPLGTVVACGGRHALVAAFLTKYYGGTRPVPFSGLERPMGTITGWDHHGLVTSTLVKLRGTSSAASIDAPMPTLTAGGNHIAEVRAFLERFYTKSPASRCDDPLPTITSRARFGLVTVNIADEPHIITDIGLRMLSTRELYAAQGFGPDYVIAPEVNGKPLTKSEQTDKCGNSVCPQVAEAIVRANVSVRARTPRGWLPKAPAFAWGDAAG